MFAPVTSCDFAPDDRKFVTTHIGQKGVFLWYALFLSIFLSFFLTVFICLFCLSVLFLSIYLFNLFYFTFFCCCSFECPFFSFYYNQQYPPLPHSAPLVKFHASYQEREGICFILPFCSNFIEIVEIEVEEFKEGMLCLVFIIHSDSHMKICGWTFRRQRK
jgi:hypothetical protein